MINTVQPAKLIKSLFYVLLVTFISTEVLFENDYILESTKVTTMDYLGNVALLYVGVLLGVWWATQYKNFVERCRRSYVDGVWKSEVIKDYLNREDKYFRYWLIRKALNCVVILLGFAVLVALIYPITTKAITGWFGVILWGLFVVAIEIAAFSFVMNWLKKSKPNFYTRLNELMNEVKKY